MAESGLKWTWSSWFYEEYQKGGNGGLNGGSCSQLMIGWRERLILGLCRSALFEGGKRLGMLSRQELALMVVTMLIQ